MLLGISVQSSRRFSLVHVSLSEPISVKKARMDESGLLYPILLLKNAVQHGIGTTLLLVVVYIHWNRLPALTYCCQSAS